MEHLLSCRKGWNPGATPSSSRGWLFPLSDSLLNTVQMEICPQSIPSFGSTPKIPCFSLFQGCSDCCDDGIRVLPHSSPFPDTCVFKVCLGHRKHPLPHGPEGLYWIKTHHRFQILGSNSHISTEIPSTPFRYQSDRIYPDFWNVPHSSISTSSGLQIPQLQLCPESRVPYSQCHLPVCFPELLCAFLCIQPSTKGRGRKRKEG